MTAPTLPPEAESWLHIGPGTYYAPDIALKVWLPSERVVIGNYCSIAERVSIFTGGMTGKTICVLSDSCATPVKSGIEKFRGDFEALIKKKKVHMLVLVLGSSYPILFIGWEGVGLCSYLLIGFWFKEKANADAGKKAFIVNRIGDFGFLIAM